MRITRVPFPSGVRPRKRSGRRGWRRWHLSADSETLLLGLEDAEVFERDVADDDGGVGHAGSPAQSELVATG
ncbi:hypothetical protein ACIBG0_41770, partial [Nocardia sp. NPDC050630]|uniref:hypothetical protein n=1 Tax=Nocardia sp. NPDC050630 TaxID=3364321 RepID=UPI00379D57C7